MIEWMGKWICSIAAASICLSFLQALLPKGAVQTITKATGGLVLTLVMLGPLLDLDITGMESRYDDYQNRVDEQIANYTQSYQRQMEQLIQEETGAYISKKAGQMGIDCQVRVVTQLHDGIPVPEEVILSTQKDPVLAVWITGELGIDEMHQHWEDIQ